MQIHNLKGTTRFKRAQRIGRGGKRGTTSGRGTKGQKARAGAKIRPATRDILKRIPKLRGYKFKSFRKKPAVVNFKDIAAKFKPGEVVSPERLFAMGVVRKTNGKIPAVKILGTGELKKDFVFKDVLFSRSAARRINN